MLITESSRFRAVSLPDAVVTTYAGKEATRWDGPIDFALFTRPLGMAIDSKGVIWVGDGNAVRRIVCPATATPSPTPSLGTSPSPTPSPAPTVTSTPSPSATPAAACVVSTLAGNFQATTVSQVSATDGQGSNAVFAFPLSLALDSGGNILCVGGGREGLVDAVKRYPLPPRPPTRPPSLAAFPSTPFTPFAASRRAGRRRRWQGRQAPRASLTGRAQRPSSAARTTSPSTATTYSTSRTVAIFACAPSLPRGS